MERKRFCEVTKMAGMTAGNEKIYDAMWRTKIVHTTVNTTVHTGVHTQHGSLCFLGVFYEYLRTESIKRISRYSTC